MARSWIKIVALAFLAAGSWAWAEQPAIVVSPPSVDLRAPEASQQLLVTARNGKRPWDVTRQAIYAVGDPRIAGISKSGRVTPRAEGRTEIIVRWEKASEVKIPLSVRGMEKPPAVSFRRDVIPILSKASCNSGGCHGKAEGQNGFKLSVFGFDPELDHSALVKQGRGRRITVAAPRRSLLLRKATAIMPHGGGQKIVPGSLWYRRLRRWIAEGVQLDDTSAPHIAGIDVEPTHVILDSHGGQQLRITATDSNGLRRCVTVEAEYQSNAEAIADVNQDGLIKASDVPGEAAILVRYMGHVAVCRVTHPQSRIVFRRPKDNNFIDKAVWDKLEQLGIQPSKLANDATFLRRVYLDTIGTLPRPEEARRFLNDRSPDKRDKLIQRLLEREEYADYWALRWADILRVDKSIVTPQGAVAMTRWLRRQFKANTSYDKFARAIVTARGNTLAESPAAFYQVHKDAQMLGRSVSQVFLGIRIECAQCHHHPFERWSQSDYFGFAGFFTGVGRKAAPTGGMKIFPQPGSDLTHPRTKEVVKAAGLGAAPARLAKTDRRQALADWLTSADNPFFARMIANRLWAHYFGRGLVDPIDDMRATNPASNEPLMDALAKHLVEVKFDLKAFTRTLLNSRVYQLDSQTNPSNKADEQNYSHAAWKPLPAEVLLDAICQATGISEQFNGWPEGYRAIQVWDNRMPSYFFQVFGRPQRVSVCECERGNEPSIAQALHLMNSPESVRKIRHRDGRAAILAGSQRSAKQIVNELYLATLSRFPSSQELRLMTGIYNESTGRREATEDVLWALLNTRSFVYSR